MSLSTSGLLMAAFPTPKRSSFMADSTSDLSIMPFSLASYLSAKGSPVLPSSTSVTVMATSMLSLALSPSVAVTVTA